MKKNEGTLGRAVHFSLTAHSEFRKGFCNRGSIRNLPGAYVEDAAGILIEFRTRGDDSSPLHMLQ